MNIKDYSKFNYNLILFDEYILISDIKNLLLATKLIKFMSYSEKH